MKKLAILLGTLAIAASAFAGGKEVVPAPATTTVVKEVERVVYRDRGSNGGSIDVRYVYFGKPGAFKKDHLNWYRSNGYAGNKGRIQIEGSNIALTERDSLYFRVRSHHPIGAYGKNLVTGVDTYSSASSAFRVRLSHKHDLLNATSRLHYEKGGEYSDLTFVPLDGHNLEYQFRIPLSELIGTPDWLSATVAPKLGISWDGAGNGEHAQTYYGGFDLYSAVALPANFKIEFNLYTGYYSASEEVYGDLDSSSSFKKNAFAFAVELYLKNSTKLAEWGNTTLSFEFEGGADNYKWNQYKNYVSTKDAKATNGSLSLYAYPALKLTHNVSDTFQIFVQAGAEIRNTPRIGSIGAAIGYPDLTNKYEGGVEGFTVAPTGFAGFKVSF
jgi:hypothetical protein